jgi:hypothetical protein
MVEDLPFDFTLKPERYRGLSKVRKIVYGNELKTLHSNVDINEFKRDLALVKTTRSYPFVLRSLA